MTDELPSQPTPPPVPEEIRSAQRSLRSDLNLAVALTSVLLTLFSTGAQAATLKLLGLDDSITLVQTFFRTAPLTIALTTSILVWLIWAGDGMETFGKWFFTTAVCLLAAMLIGNALGALQVEMPPAYVGNNFWESIKGIGLVRMFRGYYAAYGPSSFWSSFVLAGFLVFAIIRIKVAAEKRQVRVSAMAPPSS